MQLTPMVYHVPIIIGDTDQHYTYYIYRKNHTCAIPTGTSDYAKACLELFGDDTDKNTNWFIASSLGSITAVFEQTAHSYIAPETPEGFHTPEEALEALLNYLKRRTL